MTRAGAADGLQLSRRRFGTLVLGGCAYWLANGAMGRARSSNDLPQGVAPVLSDGTYRDGLTRSTPEAEGVSSAAILAFLQEVEAANLELHSFMLMRNRNVIAEGWWWPYRSDRIHITHSLTKSVTAVAVGLAVDEGRFGLQDKVASFFPEFVPANASANLRAMTVGDLLTMRCGHDKETSGSLWRPIKTSWVAEFFKIPVVHPPGTHFKYTSAASYMLSAIVSKTTGQSMADYLKPRFMEPMGIDRWHWDTSPGGISPGGNGLTWNTAASLKLGALHQQLGMWNGNRVLSEKWVRAATTKQAEGDSDGAYGYQWWMGPGSAYYGLGLFTQMSIVFPQHNTTLALFSAIDGSKKLKPIIWKHFPAALGNGKLPVSAASKQLSELTTHLHVLEPLNKTSSPLAAKLDGKRLAIQSNDQSVKWVSFDFSEAACTYRMADADGEHEITAGLAEYLEQHTSMTGHRLHHEYRPKRQAVIAGARWLAPNKLEMTWQFVETAFRDTVLCTFSDNAVAIDRSVNLNSAETRLPTLTGTWT
jgi:CubicO group peptidase (beta-lactamase class C family)